MTLSKSQNEILHTLRPSITTFGKPTLIWIFSLLVCIAFGMYALFLQITKGHIVTGMRDNVVWGLFIANFIFLIGISYAGAILTALLCLLNVSWRKPILRISALVTVSAAFIGPIFILLCIGRFDRMHYLFIYARLQSPITWDVMAITTYLVGAIIFLYLLLIEDFAIYRDAVDLQVPAWRRSLYKTLALGYTGTKEQSEVIEKLTKLISLIMIPMMVIVSSVLSWIFGMTLRPGWHSTIFGPYFVIASIFSGVGVIIVGMWIFRKLYKLESIITDKHFVNMGYVMLILAATYGYFSFSEYLTSWYGSQKWDAEVVSKLFNTEEYGWWFLLFNIFGILVPILVIALPFLRKTNLIALSAFLMVMAMWVRRYLIVVPTLETPLLPVQDTRMEYVHYSPTWVEWSLTFAGVASFLLIFTIAAKFVTIISVSEYADKKLK